MSRSDGAIQIDPSALEAYCRAILEGYGTDEVKSARVGHALVEADRCGHSSHGVRQMPYYVRQIEMGELDVTAEPAVTDNGGALITVDGRFGFGHVIAMQAADLAIGRAASTGAALVAVRNANHIGRVGEYTDHVAERGCAAMLFVNSQGGVDEQVAPFGGVERRLNNNPISMAVPGGLNIDLALSVVAEGRIHQAHERGQQVPAGWILDRDGASTTDPGDYLSGGSLLPLGGVEGGYKGYGLIVLIEAMVGMLAGVGMAGSSLERFSNAFVIVCVNPGDEERGRYLAELSGFTSWVRSSRTRPGFDEILLPGEMEERNRAANSTITLDSTTLAMLESVALPVGVRLGGDR